MGLILAEFSAPLRLSLDTIMHLGKDESSSTLQFCSSACFRQRMLQIFQYSAWLSSYEPRERATM